MNRLEQMLAEYPHLECVYSAQMPLRLWGYCTDEVIFINARLNMTKAQELVTIAEEIGHHVTGVGNITEEKTIIEQKQEAKARLWGNQYLVSLDDLIHCWEKGYHRPDEIADELEITIECVVSAIESYRNAKGMNFSHNGYH